MKSNILILLVFLCLINLSSTAQIPGGQTAVFVAANEPWTGQTFPAILKLPDDYSSTTRRYPLLIFLHGAGEYGNINGTQLSNIYNSSTAGGPAYFAAHGNFPDSFANPLTGQYTRFIILSPQAPGWSTASNQLKFIINDMMARYRVDSTRIYLTGLSAGGQGVMDYVTLNGTIPVYHTAAIVPMSAAAASSQSGAAVIVTDSIHAWGFGSDPEDTHGVQTHLEMGYMNLLQPGIARFTNYAGGHCCWNTYYNPAYKETINGHSMNIYEWLLQYTRPAIPTQANAGPDQNITLPVSTVTLNGTGIPATGHTIVSYSWVQLSGPAGAYIQSPINACTQVISLVKGSFTFRFSVTDDAGTTAADDISVTVNPANILPVSRAGNDQTIILPDNIVNLSGSGSDTDGYISSFQWRRISGPASCTFSQPAAAATSISNLTRGIYQIELAVTDNSGGTGRDTLLISVDLPAGTCGGVRRVLTHETWGAFYSGKNFIYFPGDTLVVKASDGWGALGLGLEGFHGTAQCPVVLINEGEPFTALGSLLVRNSSYVKVTGSGSSAFYGFQSNNAFSAIDIDGRSDHIEVERWRVTNAGYICRAKQDPSCADSLNYPNWRMDHIAVHDIWAKGIFQDGMYFGNTAPTGGRPFYCNGVLVDPIPMRLSNVSIYNNYIDSTGRTGIQLSGCDSGFNEIYNNYVRTTGFELNQTQGSGIIIGGMAHAYVHDNTTRETFQYGILSLGSGFSRIENNDIDSSGILNGSPNPGYDFSIACNAITTIPLDSSMIWIRNNKVDNHDASNIVTGSSAGTWVVSGNIICGNIRQDGQPAVIYLNGPGFNYSADCTGANHSPVANAGAPRAVLLPVNRVTLNGTGTDLDGTIAGYNWNQKSGPAGSKIISSHNASTSVTGLVQGIYTFELTVTDNGGASAKSNVVITVNPLPGTH